MDQNLKRLMKELGEAINTSVSEAEPIADVIGRIKEQGYDVFLVLEATIGFNKRDTETESQAYLNIPETVAEPELRIKNQDMLFLRSLRISLGEQPDDEEQQTP